MKIKEKNNIYINLINKYDFGFDILKLSKKIVKEVIEFEKIDCDISVNISLVGLSKIKSLNKHNRNIDKTTDVLSFPNILLKRRSDFDKIIGDKSMYASIFDYNTKSIFIGDIVICYNKVISQSKKYCHSVKREYSFLLTHSMLHLLGYDHMNAKDEKIMFEKQDYILDKLRISK